MTLFVGVYNQSHWLSDGDRINARKLATELFGWDDKVCAEGMGALPIDPALRANDVGFVYCHAFPYTHEVSGDGFGWVAAVTNAPAMNKHLDLYNGVFRRLYCIQEIPLIKNGDENVYCRMAPKREWGSGI
ncbi:hypothetical protein KFU94_14500 [Chloroflexi bacterium TSY]|nr:hypothetical protein [Chloroflexi bacterium TSY]